MKEAFIEKRFNRSSIAVIDHANIIIADHRAEGFYLTLRQLYYQFVYRGLIRNSDKEYKRISNIINDARLAGLIDWDAIEDRTRFLRRIPHYSNASQFLNDQAKQYAEDLWAGQAHYCEVWVEKAALVGIVESPCVRYRVPFLSCQGYASQTSQYEAGVRLRRIIEQGRNVTIFHLGDHDPVGLDISRDIDDRLNMFARSLAGVKVVRLALNRDQIVSLGVPCDPSQSTDAWELDAFPPKEIERLIVSSIEGVLNMSVFKLAYEHEEASRKQILHNIEV